MSLLEEEEKDEVTTKVTNLYETYMPWIAPSRQAYKWSNHYLFCQYTTVVVRNLVCAACLPFFLFPFCKNWMMHAAAVKESLTEATLWSLLWAISELFPWLPDSHLSRIKKCVECLERSFGWSPNHRMMNWLLLAYSVSNSYISGTSRTVM